jgi:spore coat polysaccharide biosynthesis protein SpsF
VLICCDGSAEVGMGHVVRCLALADELRDRHGAAVTFAMRGSELGIGRVQAAGYPVVQPGDGPFDYAGWLEGAIAATGATALVLDVRDELSADQVRRVKETTGVAISVIDDPTDRRLVADDVFYPPVPQVGALQWPGFTGAVHSGWQWVLLRREFADEPVRDRRSVPTVLVTMGGSDPAGFTLKAVRALARVASRLECRVLVGPGFARTEELASLAMEFPHRLSLVRSGDVRGEMLAADLGLISFGMTAYEAAACALPAVHLSLSADHAMSSSAFAKAGVAVSLGEGANVTEEAIAAAVEALIADAGKRATMGRDARKLVDGRGAERTAAHVIRSCGGVDD